MRRYIEKKIQELLEDPNISVIYKILSTGEIFFKITDNKKVLTLTFSKGYDFKQHRKDIAELMALWFDRYRRGVKFDN